MFTEAVNMKIKPHGQPHFIYLSCEREKTQWGGPQYESNLKEENSYLWNVSCGKMFPIWDSGDIRFQELRKRSEAQGACSKRDKRWSHQVSVFHFSVSMHFIFKTWPLFFLHIGDFLLIETALWRFRVGFRNSLLGGMYLWLHQDSWHDTYNITSAGFSGWDLEFLVTVSST